MVIAILHHFLLGSLPRITEGQYQELHDTEGSYQFGYKMQTSNGGTPLVVQWLRL